MKRVGHDDMDTTMKIYSHITAKMAESADEKFMKLSKECDFPVISQKKKTPEGVYKHWYY
jgi:hypothetical protein